MYTSLQNCALLFTLQYSCPYICSLFFLLEYNVFEIGRCYGMEMNVEKASNENFKTTNSSHNEDRPKTTGECEMF
jgi:hypothetical protein